MVEVEHIADGGLAVQLKRTFPLSIRNGSNCGVVCAHLKLLGRSEALKTRHGFGCPIFETHSSHSVQLRWLHPTSAIALH